MKTVMTLALLMMVCTTSACTSTFAGNESASYMYSAGIAFEPQPFDGFSTF